MLPSQLPVRGDRRSGFLCNFLAHCLATLFSWEIKFSNFKLHLLQNHQSQKKSKEILIQLKNANNYRSRHFPYRERLAEFSNNLWTLKLYISSTLQWISRLKHWPNFSLAKFYKILWSGAEKVLNCRLKLVCSSCDENRRRKYVHSRL